MKIKEFINKMFGRKENGAKNKTEEENIQKQLEQLKVVMKEAEDMEESGARSTRAEEIANKLNDYHPSFIVSLENINKAFERLGEQLAEIEPKLFSPVQVEVEQLEKIMHRTKKSRIKKKLAKRIEQLQAKCE